MIALVGVVLLATGVFALLALFRSRDRSVRFNGIAAPTPEEARIHANAQAQRAAIANAKEKPTSEMTNDELEQEINDPAPLVPRRK